MTASDARVVALYRYPVKSFTPESRESLTVLPQGHIAGDRVFGFRFASSEAADAEWSRKQEMVALMHTPGVASLRLEFDQAAQRMKISQDDCVLADEALDDAGRRRLCDAVVEFESGLPESTLREHPEHLPLRLVGDGRTPRYHDRLTRNVTLHGRASLAPLADALGDETVNEVRFRSNIVIDGIQPFEEQSWIGRSLRLGEVEFRVDAPVIRCLATHANPETGERDRPVMTTLTRVLGQEQPVFAVALVPLGVGDIHLGDEIKLL